MKIIRFGFIFTILSFVAAATALAQAPGSIAGTVTDSLGAVVVGATVTVVPATGQPKTAVTNARGEYDVKGLAPGKYTVKVFAQKFALYENTEVEVTAGEKTDLMAVLMVGGVEENVEVSNRDAVSSDPDANSSATVIKGSDLDALPDDPDELQAALQAMAGASAGPNGGQIYIDGFTGGQLPPKESIREIRINQNPFSAEYDRLGMGRIEILTRPGSDKWRGGANFNFNDESLNSRNPFATNRAPTQQRNFGTNISGPIKKGKTSFSFDINKRDSDNNAIVNAQILDPNFNVVEYRQDFTVPSRNWQSSVRLDQAFSPNHTLVARYSFNSRKSDNFSGGISLPSVASKSTGREHELRLTETSIINNKTVNETRFEFSDNLNKRSGDNSIPTITVASSFTGGGSQVGESFTKNKVFEIGNYTTTTFGRNSQHAVKFGIRFRRVNIDDHSENGFGGSFTFAGAGTVADPYDIDGDGVLSSIEQYRAKVSGGIGARYNPTQFNITTGVPDVGVTQNEIGIFATDDWRVHPSLLLSFGLRYERQTNISSNMNFAPRFGFAWSPGAGGAKAPKTVFRGGAGIFYERFSENNTLTAERFNGTNQLNLIVSANDPDPVRRAAALQLLALPVFTLESVTNVPTASQILAALPQSNTIRQVDPNLQAPYTMQLALSMERQLPWRTTMTVFFTSSRTLHVGRLRNINAPICNDPSIVCTSAPRPQPTLGSIYEYEANGVRNDTRLFFNFRTNFNQRVSLFGNYSLGFSKSNADGFGSFPAYTYDFAGEYGRAGGDIRHNINIAGSITLPWNVTLNPNITFRTGGPYNITRGLDLNGDGLFTERPTYGQLASRCSELSLAYSFCDIGSNDPNAIIPRNYGQAPSFFSVSMRIGRNFGFGKSPAARTAANGGGGGRQGGGGGGGDRGAVMMAGGPGGGGRMMMGGPGGGFGGFGGDNRKPYNLNIGVQITNLFNNVNYNAPIGSLNSSRFGQYTSTSGGFGGFGGFGGGAANRRIELQARFSW